MSRRPIEPRQARHKQLHYHFFFFLKSSEDDCNCGCKGLKAGTYGAERLQNPTYVCGTRRFPLVFRRYAEVKPLSC